MTRMLRLLISVIACTMVVAPAHAQILTYDHLLCSKVKERGRNTKFTVDLLPRLVSQFPALTGCKVKTPAKLLCQDAAKTSVTPTPPGTTSGVDGAQRYLCYDVKCPKQNVPSVPVNDQFGGGRTVTASNAKMLCAPASVASPSGAFLDESSGLL